MKNNFMKSCLRNVRATLGRFLSIIGVSLLGAGVLAGLLAIAPEMRETADTYFDSQKISDIRILSPLGFTNQDLLKLEEVDSVEILQEGFYFDSIGEIENNKYTMRVHRFPSTENKINQLLLVDGRLPQKAEEVVMIRPPDGLGEITIGDTVVFDINDLSDSIIDNEFKIVGIVQSGLYPHNRKASTSKGNGTIDFVLFASDKSFQEDSINEVFVKLENTEELNTFSSLYTDKVTESVESIESFSTEQAKKRHDELLEKVLLLEASADNMDVAIQELKNDLHVIQNPQWYFETRNQNQGYAIYKGDAQSMEGMATIFPIIFFMVAALVSLTTMTRMIDDERTLIGTFKALGYSDKRIAGRYLGYSISATLIGSMIGVYLGFKVLPKIVWTAYSYDYSVPDPALNFHWNFAIISVVTMLLITTLTTVFTINRTLKNKTSELLTPKAPTAGKRILLEKIPFIWSRLSFSKKVTQRNIFLDKKRMFMTIIGIIGSTALLVTGFALKNSIDNFPSEQYKNIMNYDLVSTFDETLHMPEDLQRILEDISEVLEYLPLREEGIEIKTDSIDSEKYNISLTVPEDYRKLDSFITFENSGNKIAFEKDSIIITHNIANILNVSVGDTVDVKLLDSAEFVQFTVTGITKNLELNYLYISSDTYTSTFRKEVKFNKSLVNITDNTSHLSTEEMLNELNSVNNVERSAVRMLELEENLSSVDMVVIIMIVLAIMLAIIVLYNVTNINIEERKREIATIKVLGFYEKETNAYIFRETVGLSVMGMIIGLVVGIFLFGQVTRSLETEIYAFDKTLNVSTFVYSAIIVLVFTIIINFIMIPKIKRIDMLESLKSNE